MRTLLLVGIAFLFGAAAARALAGEAEPLRWRFDKIDGYVYKIGGAQATKILPDELLERTLYPADIRDGRALAHPAGKPIDLVFQYAFRLPGTPLDPGASLPVRDVHDGLPRHVGSVIAEGDVKCAARKGPAHQLVWTLRLAASGPRGPGSFASGSLSVTSLFHQKKGALASADFAIEWKEEGGKAHAFKGTIELARPIDLSVRKLDAAVEKAVGRGVVILKDFVKDAKYRKGTYPLGWVALAVFALEKAGVDPNDLVLRAGFEDFDSFPPLGGPPGVTPEVYSVALAILAIEGKSVRRAPPSAGAGATAIRYEKGNVEKADLDRLEKLTRWLIEAREKGRGNWHYRSFAERKGNERFGDLSNIQFAVLALHSASRSGVHVPPEVFEEVAKTLISLQKQGPEIETDLVCAPDSWLARAAASGETATRTREARGWNYYIGSYHDAPYASMTAAAVSSLLICREELERARALDPALGKKVEASVRDGLAWLERHHSMRHNFPDYGGWPMYHLYSLEKAFEIGRVERIGGHDWWAEGAQEILLREKPGALGGWGGIDQTALALLFLCRATMEPEIAAKELGRLASGAENDPDAVVVEGFGALSVREVLGALEVRDAEKRRERLELAEKAIGGYAEERRPELIPALGRLLGSAYPDVGRAAGKWLQAIAGEKVPDAASAQALFVRWSEATALGKAGDPAAIPALRERVRGDPAPLVRRAAALALARLNAFEAVPDLIEELGRDDREYRAYIHHVLVGLVVRDPGWDEVDRKASIERWRRTWAEAAPAATAREGVRRAVRDLGDLARYAEAKKKLLAAGPAAVRPLIDAMRDDALRADAALLLEEITGKRFGPDPDAWEAWWRAGGGTAGND